MDKNNDIKFIPLKVQINSFGSYLLNEKLDILRKLSKDITFNEDYQQEIIDNNFIQIILTDLSNIIFSSDKNNEKDKLTYVRLFLMFLHNELGNDSIKQKNLFNQIFLIAENFKKFEAIFNKYILDLKVQKFLLGIIYKLFLLNTYILTNELNKKYINLFFVLLEKIDYKELSITNEDNKKDKEDINDWIHISFTYILKNEEEIKNIENETFLQVILKNDKNNIYFEIIRDVIEYLKQSKILLISIKNINYLCEVFSDSISKLNNIINENSHYLNEKYELISSNPNFILLNKKIICGSDIMSVLLTTEDLNNNEYRNTILTKIETIVIFTQILQILKSTDVLYDKTFNRSKGEKDSEKKLNLHLEHSNYFYGLQTNLIKFMSNFCYRNEKAKKFFIENPKEFYYMLNHLKMDKCNPVKYEYSVLMIKALCEECIKIQNLIQELKPMEMDPFLKDYIINKGKQKITFAENEKELYFSMLNKKKDS